MTASGGAVPDSEIKTASPVPPQTLSPGAAAALVALPAVATGAYIWAVNPKLRKKIKQEFRDPRLYSNLRGAASLESREERVKAHRGLGKNEKGTVLEAMRIGFGRKTAALTPNLMRLSTFAKRLKKYPVEHINATNQALMRFTPAALPVRPAAAAPVVATVARKKAPTQAIDVMALPRYLAKTNPQQAIQAGRQFGAPVVGTASVLDQLNRMSFDKLSRLRAAAGVA